jgi:SRSO17 transposase
MDKSCLVGLRRPRGLKGLLTINITKVGRRKWYLSPCSNFLKSSSNHTVSALPKHTLSNSSKIRNLLLKLRLPE